MAATARRKPGRRRRGQAAQLAALLWAAVAAAAAPGARAYVWCVYNSGAGPPNLAAGHACSSSPDLNVDPANLAWVAGLQSLFDGMAAGDTVYFAPGAYPMNSDPSDWPGPLIVKVPVTLRGANWTTPAGPGSDAGGRLAAAGANPVGWSFCGDAITELSATEVRASASGLAAGGPACPPFVYRGAVGVGGRTSSRPGRRALPQHPPRRRRRPPSSALLSTP
jgi:hypothetical protein